MQNHHEGDHSVKKAVEAFSKHIGPKVLAVMALFAIVTAVFVGFDIVSRYNSEELTSSKSEAGFLDYSSGGGSGCSSISNVFERARCFGSIPTTTTVNCQTVVGVTAPATIVGGNSVSVAVSGNVSEGCRVTSIKVNEFSRGSNAVGSFNESFGWFVPSSLGGTCQNVYATVIIQNQTDGKQYTSNGQTKIGVIKAGSGVSDPCAQQATSIECRMTLSNISPAGQYNNFVVNSPVSLIINAYTNQEGCNIDRVTITDTQGTLSKLSPTSARFSGTWTPKTAGCGVSLVATGYGSVKQSDGTTTSFSATSTASMNVYESAFDAYVYPCRS